MLRLNVIVFLIISVLSPIAFGTEWAVNDTIVFQSERPIFNRASRTIDVYVNVQNSSDSYFSSTSRIVVNSASLPIQNSEGKTLENQDFFLLSEALPPNHSARFVVKFSAARAMPTFSLKAVEEIESGSVSSEGGAIEVFDHESELFRAKVEVPEGAVGETTLFTVKKGVETDEEGFLGIPIDFGPDGAFDESVRISIPLMQTATEPFLAFLYVFDEVAGKYVRQGTHTTVQEGDNVAVFTVDHFTSYHVRISSTSKCREIEGGTSREINDNFENCYFFAENITVDTPVIIESNRVALVEFIAPPVGRAMIEGTVVDQYPFGRYEVNTISDDGNIDKRVWSAYKRPVDFDGLGNWVEDWTNLAVEVTFQGVSFAIGSAIGPNAGAAAYLLSGLLAPTIPDIENGMSFRTYLPNGTNKITWSPAEGCVDLGITCNRVPDAHVTLMLDINDDIFPSARQGGKGVELGVVTELAPLWVEGKLGAYDTEQEYDDYGDSFVLEFDDYGELVINVSSTHEVRLSGSENEPVVVTGSGTSDYYGPATHVRVPVSPGKRININMETDNATEAFYILNAAIEIPKFNVEVLLEGDGNGTVEILCNGTVCDGKSIPLQTEVKLNALPDAESFFSGWGDECLKKSASECVFIMSEDVTVSAIFRDIGANSAAITVIKNGYDSGELSINGNPCNHTQSCTEVVRKGTTVNIQAGDTLYSRFDGYTSPCGSPKGCEFNAGGNETITANFTFFNPFTILNQPDASYMPEDTVKLEFNGFGVASMRVELISQSGDVISVLSGAYPNSGGSNGATEYNWSIPTETEEGDYAFKLTVLSGDPEIISAHIVSQFFEVKHPDPIEMNPVLNVSAQEVRRGEIRVNWDSSPGVEYRVALQCLENVWFNASVERYLDYNSRSESFSAEVFADSHTFTFTEDQILCTYAQVIVTTTIEDGEEQRNQVEFITKPAIPQFRTELLNIDGQPHMNVDIFMDRPAWSGYSLDADGTHFDPDSATTFPTAYGLYLELHGDNGTFETFWLETEQQYQRFLPKLNQLQLNFDVHYSLKAFAYIIPSAGEFPPSVDTTVMGEVSFDTYRAGRFKDNFSAETYIDEFWSETEDVIVFTSSFSNTDVFGRTIIDETAPIVFLLVNEGEGTDNIYDVIPLFYIDMTKAKHADQAIHYVLPDTDPESYIGIIGISGYDESAFGQPSLESPFIKEYFVSGDRDINMSGLDFELNFVIEKPDWLTFLGNEEIAVIFKPVGSDELVVERFNKIIRH